MNIPIIKLFFDFDYASETWNRSYIKNKTEKMLSKIEYKHNFSLSEKTDVVVVTFLGICPFLGLWTENRWNIIVLALVSALYFILFLNCRELEFVLFYELILTVLFTPFISVSGIAYLLYVESAIILFFIVKNADGKHIRTMVKVTYFFWLLQSVFTSRKGASAIVAFMPYVLCISSGRKIWDYGLKTIMLAMGFYALQKYGGEALLGGGVGILAMTLLGEFGLIAPIIIVSPWIVGIGIRVIRNGLFSENIIKTGYFFWSRSLKGASFDYESVSFERYGIFVTLILSVTAFIFFWYVLRISRQAILKLFEKNNPNKKIIRAGLGAIIGFSFYTFFSKNSTTEENILIYLWCAGLLKNTCSGIRKREETEENGRKTDFG